MNVTAVVALAVLLVQFAPASYRPIAFPPVDEAPQDGSLQQFRSNLFDLIKRQSLPELRAVLEVRDDPSETDQLASKFQQFGEVRWQQLDGALRLGGAFTDTRSALRGRREFCAPYVYATYPEGPPYLGGEVEPWAITGKNVAVRSDSNLRARGVARLSYVLVEYLDHITDAYNDTDPSRPTWVLIAVNSRKKGWVSGAYIRSRNDWHVCMAKTTEGWRISKFDSIGF